MSKKELKSRPAGVKDNFDITYTHFAANNERTELRTGEGKDFDNDELLRTLGFKENGQGYMSLSATENNVEINESGEIVRRSKNGRTLTERKQEEAER